MSMTTVYYVKPHDDEPSNFVFITTDKSVLNDYVDENNEQVCSITVDSNTLHKPTVENFGSLDPVNVISKIVSAIAVGTKHNPYQHLNDIDEQCVQSYVAFAELFGYDGVLINIDDIEWGFIKTKKVV